MNGEPGDDPCFEGAREPRVFDTDLIREPLSTGDGVTQAVRAMQRKHTGCVLAAGDGSSDSRLVGIFTERDTLLRIVDRGKNLATLPMGEGA